MDHEIEVKFKVADFRAVRRALRKAGAAYLGTVLLTDTYYDTPDQSMRAEDRGLRVRRMRLLRAGAEPRDTRPQLTYKAPGPSTRRAKVRQEVQTHVEDAAAMAEVLAGCGLEVTISVQKRRATYSLGSCLIELDELPLIGCYVEVEGPGEKEIHAVAETLGLDSEPITDHYLGLLDRARRKRGLRGRRVHFKD